MDSSNMHVKTVGDLEDQRYNPKWFVDHKHMLRLNQESKANKLGYFILKMPEYMHQSHQAFSPQGWQFGLHNRENLDSSGSEALKLGIAFQYGLVGDKWDHFCNAIVDDPKAMLACYGIQNEVTSWTNEQIKHVLALDALFLANLIDSSLLENERRLWTPDTVPFLYHENTGFLSKYNMWRRDVNIDIYQVENQIPFVLIDRVVKYILISTSSIPEGNEPFIVDLQLYQQRSKECAVNTLVDICFMTTSSEAFKIDNSSLFGGKTHILGASYKVICGSKGLLMKEGLQRTIQIPSAIKLKQSGIKLIAIDGPLCTMSYEKKCLYLPMMKIYDDTISFVRNMAWYEMNTITNGCLFHDYISLMIDLIQVPEDLDLLVKHNVIYNACGMKGFEMWTTLQEGLIEIPSSETHYEMKEAIVSRCRLRRYRLWSEFKIVFCSRPWFVLSTIAVVLVTVATLVQTYIAIIGSNKMKPKFP